MHPWRVGDIRCRIRVKSPPAKSSPGKVNTNQIIAHQLNAVWSQVAASRYERHYDADKCIIARRKRLYYAVVTSKCILEVHLPWLCVIKCQRCGNRRVVFTKRTQSYWYRAETTTFCANRMVTQQNSHVPLPPVDWYLIEISRQALIIAMVGLYYVLMYK